MTAKQIEFDRERVSQYNLDVRKAILLNIAGFNNVTKFYNAFLFGGWTAQYTGN